MSMKQFKEVLSFNENYKTANAVNKEGFPAWKREGVERLREILFLGHTGNTFYVNAEQNVLEKINDLENLILDENIPVEKIKELIVSARNEGFFRTIPILALVILRKRNPEAFKEIFSQVVKTGNDLKDFLDINHTVFEGFGRAVKTALHEWLKNVNEFYVLKYRNQINDAIALSRPPVDEFENALVLKYAYAKKKQLPNETVKEIVEKLPQIKGAEQFKLLVEEGKTDEALIVAKEVRLPADLMIGVAGNTTDQEFWKTVAENMGLMQFLKYMNKLVSVGLEDYVISVLREKFTPKNIRKAKIFPYRLFVAWLNANSQAVKDELENIINRFEDEPVVPEEWKEKRWAICPDISASMTWSEKGRVKPSQVAGFFSGILGKQLDVEEVLMWDTKVYVLNTKGKSVFGIYREVAEADGGGTAMNKPIDWLIKNRKEVDIAVIITDSEHWASRRGVKEAWREYKEKVNPEAKLVVIEVVGYGTSQVDEEFATKYDVYTVFGWSESVFKWMELKVF